MVLPFPPIYLLPNHIPTDQLHILEEQIPTLTYDISEAKLVIGKVSTKQRAQTELRWRKLWTEEVCRSEKGLVSEDNHPSQEPATKRRRINPKTLSNKGKGKDVAKVDSSTESEDDNQERNKPAGQIYDGNESIDRSSPVDKVMSSPVAVDTPCSTPTSTISQDEIEWGETIKVIKLSWFTDCLSAGSILPLDQYLIYEGTPIIRPTTEKPVVTHIRETSLSVQAVAQGAGKNMLKQIPTSSAKKANGKPGDHYKVAITRPTVLLHQTTSEHDDPLTLPPIPAYLHTTYSCERPTPLTSPNDPFICELKKMKTARLLTGDEIGVRAYSTSIATLAAYPHTLTSAQEVLALPGCDQKIAHLYQEWRSTGHIADVDELESDEQLEVLRLFYDIWGVGATTAREFYGKGWRDLDDVVELGWGSLSRVQQIGVKHYEEFQEKIPRAEVEAIGNTILENANKIHPGFQMTIVGGYRRGKKESGDVDVVLSHPDENATLGFVQEIVSSLEKGNWITHTLTLSTANSERGQTPVSWKGNKTGKSKGFDTLDKALVVWQDPVWPTKLQDLEVDPKAKNPAIHRRVDIIISPWKTVGCAVAGWSSGTTFQRDLRRYATKLKNLKFDSSGIRSRENGRWVDFESREGAYAGNMEIAERRVFEGLGLEWREPWERCTG